MGLSQTDLAERIGVSRGAVGQWESGLSEPSNANMRRAADALAVTVDWLASGRGAYDATEHNGGRMNERLEDALSFIRRKGLEAEFAKWIFERDLGRP
jgi:transcriptional regulator with XRE-family HTH domain